MKITSTMVAGIGTRLLGTAMTALVLLVGLTIQGATVISKAPGVAVYTGLPFNELEFENPLAGTETVLGHAVLDWRDADYSPGQRGRQPQRRGDLPAGAGGIGIDHHDRPERHPIHPLEWR